LSSLKLLLCHVCVESETEERCAATTADRISEFLVSHQLQTRHDVQFGVQIILDDTGGIYTIQQSDITAAGICLRENWSADNQRQQREKSKRTSHSAPPLDT